MKTTKFVTAIALCATIAASCTVGNEKMDFVPDKQELVAVKLGSKNIAAMQTRVDGDQWDGSEVIGVFMTQNTTTNIIAGSGNVPYEVSSVSNPSATFAAAGAKLYYPEAVTPKVGFVAYHPYAASLEGTWGYPIDITDQSNQSAIDLMTAYDNYGAGYDNTNSSPVDLPFTHRLVKVVINVTNGSGVDASELNGMTAGITNMLTEGTFDLSTPSGFLTTPVPEPLGDITAYDAGGAVYEAIVLPINIASSLSKLVFTTSIGTYEIEIGSIHTQWLNGNKYVYNVTLARGDGEVEISGTVYDWTSGGSGDVEAHPQ
jgi:hypothetical protein